MVDLERLDAHLASDDSPEDCLMLSDLDGFLTGLACSPEEIPAIEWLPIVWGGEDSPSTGEGLWAVRAVLDRYEEIVRGLQEDPPIIEPIFLATGPSPDDDVIAMDWCEGFMEAVVLRDDQWAELMATEEGRDWMFPILAHLVDENGDSAVGARKEDLPEMLDEASKLIPGAVTGLFDYWEERRGGDDPG